MNESDSMERLYERVELVRGAGDRRRGELCIMSFVALLAGEPHTDRPKTASATLTCFAMTINDEMPVDVRQKLKPFAPRILGTRDGHDHARADLLLRAWHTEVLPQLATDFGRPIGRCDQPTRFLICAAGSPKEPATCEQIASTVARMISHYAIAVPRPKQEWYWLRAIDLLDRLCDVGAEAPRPTLDTVQVAFAGAVLEKGSNMRPRSARAIAALMRIRDLMPVLMG